MTIFELMKMAEISSKGQKTLWEEEKLFITSKFSFSHSVFKRLVLKTHKNMLVWENVITSSKQTNTHRRRTKRFYTPPCQEEGFTSIEGNGNNVGKMHFNFSTLFHMSTLSKTEPNMETTINLMCAKAFNMEHLVFC